MVSALVRMGSEQVIPPWSPVGKTMTLVLHEILVLHKGLIPNILSNQNANVLGVFLKHLPCKYTLALALSLTCVFPGLAQEP